MQDETKQTRACPIADISKIKSILSIERNPRGQIYLVQDLHKCCHFTVSTASLGAICNRNFPRSSHDFTQEVMKKRSAVKIIHIPNSHDYTSSDSGTVVINAYTPLSRRTTIPQRRNPITKCTELVTSMFHEGLSDAFSFEEKKRTLLATSRSTKKRPSVRSIASSTQQSVFSTMSKSQLRKAKKRSNLKKKKSTIDKRVHRSKGDVHRDALPTITLGWSTMNSHEYRYNKCTIAGNVKPFLRSGGVPEKARPHLLRCVEIALRALPSSTAFNVDLEEDKGLVDMRKKMIADFQHLLTGSENYDPAFRIEGITIVIPLAIGKHRDTLNCGQEGMSSVVSVNVRIPMNAKTVKGGKDSKLWKWLNLNGYFDSFPISMILYSRKSVHSHCMKMVSTRKLGEKDPIMELVSWAFLDRVGSQVDYHNRIWNDFGFGQNFKMIASVREKSRFGGRMLVCTEHYDKMVSTIECILPRLFIFSFLFSDSDLHYCDSASILSLFMYFWT